MSYYSLIDLHHMSIITNTVSYSGNRGCHDNDMYVDMYVPIFVLTHITISCSHFLAALLLIWININPGMNK